MSRSPTIRASCFLIGAATVPLGYFANIGSHGDGTRAVGLVTTIMLGVCVLASAMAQEWVTFGSAHACKANRDAGLYSVVVPASAISAIARSM